MRIIITQEELVSHDEKNDKIDGLLKRKGIVSPFKVISVERCTSLALLLVEIKDLSPVENE